jgi:hypothetical protein
MQISGKVEALLVERLGNSGKRDGADPPNPPFSGGLFIIKARNLFNHHLFRLRFCGKFFPGLL